MRRAVASQRIPLRTFLGAQGPICALWTARFYGANSVDVLDRLSKCKDNELSEFPGRHKNVVFVPSKEVDQFVNRSRNGTELLANSRIGDNISSRDKNKYLLNVLYDLKDSKEAVYHALDAWVAWEKNFPLVALKRALLDLQKDEQWHRIVQVIKWMLSKGQGNTMGTYEQLIRALEKDHRAEEAHTIWVRKISYDLHSVPWSVCDLMISIYYRNNMLERLVKLFKSLEAFDRKPTNKSIVRKVADACEMLGLAEEKERIMEKYSHLFSESSKESTGKSQRFSKKKSKKVGEKGDGNTDASENGLKVSIL